MSEMGRVPPFATQLQRKTTLKHYGTLTDRFHLAKCSPLVSDPRFDPLYALALHPNARRDGICGPCVPARDVNNGEVFVFARRQDCDDFAGLELVGGRITDKVVHFHPVFSESSKSSPRSWDIVTATYDDVFEFVAQCVVPEMKDWALTEDATDL